MSRIGDYRSRMTTSQFTDEDFELLLLGEDLYPELASLAPFVNALREQVEFEPDRDDVDRAAMRAAAVVHSQLAATRSATILTLRTQSPWRRLSERTTLVLGSVLAVAAMSGVGLAADAASPGDFLYPIDVVLEKIGVGDGATAERLTEAGVLVEREDLSGAVELLATISQADPEGDDAALGAAIEALEELLSDIDEGPGVASDASKKVSDLLDFIGANAGKGNGLDGKDFGQGVAEIASGWRDADDPGTEPTTDSGAPGNSETSNAGGSGNGNGNDGSREPPGNSDGSGNGGGSTEPPENSGNSNAGGNGNGGNGSGESPGNSGNSNAGGNGNGNGKP